ncbi:hypothetical protein [Pseudomonas aeruginosa]|uniref:hypothetical protein n=1 Tax=Pseudomonas aeruginosa TaxID=287 RepID=UPI00159911A6|nr:hypothetical protein [Pseudomonas aeruginosa]QKR11209.1 hypothetical protein HB744_22340 [Pseudomonas aeruginosa]
MSSTQHQLIEQCATRLRGIVEALDNIHDTSPQRWSTDLDDVHSSAESLLALINDQAPAPCIDCKGTGFCNSISGEEIRCPCRAPIQFADPAQSPVEQFEQAPPSEDQLIAAGLSYPLAKEDAVKLWYSGFRSEVITVLEAWEAIGHDTGINPDKGELLDSLRYMLEKCEAHDAALAMVAELERQEPVATVAKVPGEDWNSLDFHRDLQDMQPGTKLYAAPVAQAQQLHDMDKQCRDDVARALGLRPNEERGFAWSYLLSSIKACVKASENTAQAGQVPAAWYYDAPSQAEAAIIDIRGMWGEDDCPTYEDVAAALRRLLAAAPGKEVPQAWLDVQAERKRQVEVEGWTPEHDDAHSHGQMARAAACYALAGSSAPNDGTAALLVSLAWPWDEQWWKSTTPRRDLVKACALALAEIERLDRAAATQGGPSDA